MSIYRIGLVVIVLLLVVSFAGCSSSASNPVDAGLEIEATDMPRDLERFNPKIKIKVTPTNRPIKIKRDLGGMVDFHVMIRNKETYPIFPMKAWVVGKTPWGKQYWPDKKYIPDPIRLFFRPNQEFHYDWGFEMPPDLPLGVYKIKVNIGFYLCPAINIVYARDGFVIKVIP